MTEFWLHFADYGVKYIIMTAVAVAGALLGIMLRKRKDKATAAKQEI